MLRSASFKFPEVSWSAQGLQLLSFQRSGLELLGEYSPSSGATVVNPLWTGSGLPDAVARHEATHQFLTINTTFGFFTQLLMNKARRGSALAALRECIRSQWCVQELAATYDEMSLIASERPELFEESVRGLPSMRLSQPPYREVFDAMHRYLAVDVRKPGDVLKAQARLVVLLSAAAMNSDCLLRMQSAGDEESALLTCMEDSPDSRMERIIGHILARDLLQPLLEEAVEIFASVPKSVAVNEAGPLVFRRVAELVPEVAIQEDQALYEQGATVVSQLSAAGRETVIQRLATDPLPAIRDTEERHRAVLAANPLRALAAAELRERLTRTVQEGLGLSLELSLKESSRGLVTARSYFLKPGQSPLPTESKDEEPGNPLPESFQGIIPLSEVLRELDAFPSLPQVAVFISDSWRRWHEVPGARHRFSASVQVCREHNLSYELIRDNILTFERLNEGRAAQFFVSRASPERFVGHFFNPSRPLVHGLQRIPSEYGLRLFSTACERLGVPQCVNPRSIVPYLNLVTMVSFPYLW